MKPAYWFLRKEKPKSNAGFFREDKTTVRYHTPQERAMPDFLCNPEGRYFDTLVRTSNFTSVSPQHKMHEINSYSENVLTSETDPIFR